MSKVEDFLRHLKANVGEWTCAYCGSDSNQTAAIFRGIKKMGYKFEEVSPQRWGKILFCTQCNTMRTHYRLLSLEPEFDSVERIHIDKRTRLRILKLFNEIDAFTGASITGTIEIDHKIPWTRLDLDIDASKLSDTEIKQHFQLLTRDHNLLKDRACAKCKVSGIRTPFLGIEFWYDGDSNYRGTCFGCGWYDGKKWREEVYKNLK